MLSYGELTELALKIYSEQYPNLYATDGYREAQIDVGKIFYNLANDSLITQVEQALREQAESKGISI